jgi:hypothetical protein
VGLAIAIACYVLIYAASTIWSCGYSGAGWIAWTGDGAFHFETLSGSPGSVSTFTRYWRIGWGSGKVKLPPSIITKPFRYRSADWADPMVTMTSIPLWIPLLPLLLLAAMLIYRDRTRRIPGLCRKCGYDIRTVTSNHCPECGTPVPERLAASAVKT